MSVGYSAAMRMKRRKSMRKPTACRAGPTRQAVMLHVKMLQACCRLRLAWEQRQNDATRPSDYMHRPGYLDTRYMQASLDQGSLPACARGHTSSGRQVQPQSSLQPGGPGKGGTLMNNM